MVHCVYLGFCWKFFVLDGQTLCMLFAIVRLLVNLVVGCL